jgi:ATP:corrinoid adenosyltransferase
MLKMINDKEELINTLQNNIDRLKNLYEQKKVACSILDEKNAKLSGRLNEKEEAYNSLEAKFNTLKMAKVLTGSKEENLEAKVKVSNLVREIDKCIALLNR